jgi:hypothetical protein
MNGFTQDQLATLKAMGFDGGADMVCNKNKGTITAIVADLNGYGRKYKLAKNYGTNYSYKAVDKKIPQYFFDFNRLVEKIS